MNKIYKVVWSKVKHCYVVTSELAKRNGKGCGARSLRMAAVTLGVTAVLLGAGHPLFGMPAAEAADSDVSNKTVVIPSDTYPAATSANKRVFGGYAAISAPTSNVIYGGYSRDSSDSAKNNSVTIGNITVVQADGGWTAGSSIGNSVTVNGGTVTGEAGTLIAHSIVGGYGWYGNNIRDNIVTLNAGTAGNTIIAGIGYGTISGNKVVINSGSTVKGVQGGNHPNYDTYSLLDKNSVTITGSTVDGAVQGAWITRYVSDGNIISNNKVSITGSEVSGDVYGGGMNGGSGTLTISGNEVTLGTGANVAGSVYGGRSLTAAGTVLSKNKVTMNGGKALNVYGAYTQGGAAETNHVVVNGGTVAATNPTGAPAGGLVYGGYSETSDNSDSGNVTGNTVTVNSGTVIADIFGAQTYAKGDSTSGKSGKAENNTVTIEGGSVNGSIFGAYSVADHNTSGNVTGNKVEIKGGTLKTNSITFGGKSYSMQGVRNIYGGSTFGKDSDTGDNSSGIAKDNAVTVSGGTLRDDTRVIGGNSNGSNAEHNTVTITKTYTGTVGDVIGGQAQLTATKNEVAINGGTAKGNVLGALSFTGTAGGDAAAAGNKATVDSATVEGI